MRLFGRLLGSRAAEAPAEPSAVTARVPLDAEPAWLAERRLRRRRRSRLPYRSLNPNRLGLTLPRASSPDPLEQLAQDVATQVGGVRDSTAGQLGLGEPRYVPPLDRGEPRR